MNSIESTGKKLDDAIRAGLEILGVGLDEVDVEIISSGGFLKKAKVKLTVIEHDDDLEELKNYSHSLAEESHRAERAEREKEERRLENEQRRREKEEKRKLQAEKQAQLEAEKQAKKEQQAQIEQVEEVVEEEVEEEEVSSIGEIKIVPDRPKTAKTEKAKKEKAKKDKPKREEKEYPPATEEQIEKAKTYTEGLIKAMGIEGEVEVSADKNVITVNVISESALVIGHRGETLDAIGTLCKRVVESDDGHVRLVVDSKGYRTKREETLIRLAKKTAERCVKKGRKIALEPMDSHQRKIIHSALTDDERVFTKSDGREPNRRVVVFPVRYKKRRNDNDVPVKTDNDEE